MSDEPFMMSVDPGVSGGWAMWRSKVKLPYATGVWNAPEGLDWVGKAWQATRAIDDAMDVYEPVIVWCEWPSLHESSEAGMKSARSGDLIKLAASAGMVVELCRTHGCRFKEFGVGEWKGQMSKEAVKHRIRRILGPANCLGFRTHAWDAVGIGLHAKGHFQI